MRADAIDRLFHCPGLRREIQVIAAQLVSDLPRGQARKFYARAARRHAALYRARTMIDAPMGDDGWALLDRRTVYVGGLRELDALHRQQAA